MALKLVNQAGNALGQFDVLDSQLSAFKGGEVVTFVSTTLSADAGAADVADGYVNPSAVKRPVVTKTLSSSSRPLMLADDGVVGYGTLFGSVVGGTVGQQVVASVAAGTVLGPHTATGSGKMTCWHLPGVYAVSLDSCHSSLQPTTSLDVGATLSYTAAGLLCAAASSVSGAPVVATLIDFESNGSLVTTPNRLVSALNSPSGTAETVRSFPTASSYAVFYFNPPVA